MTLSQAWMEFQTVALPDKSAAEIEAIKPIFYAGMTASLFELQEVLGFMVGVEGSSEMQNHINALFKEFEDYANEVHHKATKEGA